MKAKLKEKTLNSQKRNHKKVMKDKYSMRIYLTKLEERKLEIEEDKKWLTILNTKQRHLLK